MPISRTGVVLTPSSTALAEAQQILIDSFGENVNLAPESPNGQLIQNMAIAITQRENEQADTVNSFNPLIATGIQLDAIASNLGIERKGATFSTATCIFSGISGTTIPVNTQVASVSSDIFLVEATVVIGSGGTVSGSVVAQNSGPISTTSNTITTVVTGISGWSSVNNPTNGTIGVVEQDDSEFLQAIFLQRAASSAGSVPAIQAGAAALNPISSYVTDNKTQNDVSIDGITIFGNSVLLVIDGGGSDLDIATMLYKKISGGCAMSGSTSYSLPVSGNPVPFVARWQIPTRLALSLNIILKLGGNYPPNISSFIADIINLKFDFNIIGQSIFATEFIAMIIDGGINPIRSLTFGVGSIYNLYQYTMPISSDLGSSILSSNVVVTYV